MTNTLADLKLGLSEFTADNPVKVSIAGGSMYDLLTSDLDTPLGVTPKMPPVVFTVAYQAKANTSVNVRQHPTTSALIELTLTPGETVNVATDVPQTANGHTWVRVRTASGVIGWCAQEFLDKVIVQPPAPVTHRLGLHSLLDGRSKVEDFVARGAQLASITVVGDAGYANTMAQAVPYTIYRPAAPLNPLIPDDPMQAEAFGHEFVRTAFAADNELGDVDLQVYVLLVNEVKFTPGHGGFWLGYQKELLQMGRKAAIGGYGVGQPEPTEWASLTSALQFAQANGNVVCLHSYCSPTAQPGQLSAPADQPFYELRFPRLYAAVPADARPPLIISEFAGEEKTGRFTGTDNLLSLLIAYLTAIALYVYVVSVNLWTAGAESGEWQPSSIDSALTDSRVVDLYQ